MTGRRRRPPARPPTKHRKRKPVRIRKPTQRTWANFSLSDLAPQKTGPRTSDAVSRPRSIKRTQIIGAIIAVCYVGLIAQAARIMLTPDSQLENKARVQFEQAVELQGRRGDVLARDGSLLATTAELYDVHVNPARIGGHAAEVAAVLGPLLEQDPQAIQQRIEARAQRQDIPIQRGLTPQQGQILRQAMRPLVREDRSLQGAVWLEAEQRRFYTGRSDAAPILGLVGHNGAGEEDPSPHSDDDAESMQGADSGGDCDGDGVDRVAAGRDTTSADEALNAASAPRTDAGFEGRTQLLARLEIVLKQHTKRMGAAPPVASGIDAVTVGKNHLPDVVGRPIPDAGMMFARLFHPRHVIHPGGRREAVERPPPLRIDRMGVKSADQHELSRGDFTEVIPGKIQGKLRGQRQRAAQLIGIETVGIQARTRGGRGGEVVAPFFERVCQQGPRPQKVRGRLCDPVAAESERVMGFVEVTLVPARHLERQFRRQQRFASAESQAGPRPQ